MTKRTMPILVLSCILALAGLAGYLLPETPEANPNRLLMENAGGRVVFTHKAHSTPGGGYGDIPCLTCHHELQVAPAALKDAADPQVMSCTACHGTADQPDFVQAHQERYRAQDGDKSCIRCHHGRMEGFSDRWNHKDHWEYVDDGCATCHHEARFEFKPGRVLNVKPQKCANCHTQKPNPLTATTFKAAGHQRCGSCHADFFEQGAAGCATCHGIKSFADQIAQDKAPDPGKDFTACANCHKPLSGPMDAYHGRCMTCHDKVGKGPGEKAPCAQCHTP